jgi:hypothetical protein
MSTPKKARTNDPLSTTSGLKKRRNGKDIPPTPLRCEWRKTDDGWNLSRYWSERDEETGRRVKMIRHAGSLSHDAWQVMKDYDYETYISMVGERFRRNGR